MLSSDCDQSFGWSDVSSVSQPSSCTMTSDEDDVASQASSAQEGKSFKKKLQKKLKNEKVLTENGSKETSEMYEGSPTKVKNIKIKTEPFENQSTLISENVNGTGSQGESTSGGSTKKFKKNNIKLEQYEEETSTKIVITERGNEDPPKKSKKKKKSNRDSEEIPIDDTIIVKQETETCKTNKNKRKSEDADHSIISNEDNHEKSFCAPPEQKKRKKHSSVPSDVPAEQNIDNRPADSFSYVEEPRKKKKKSITFADTSDLELAQLSAKNKIRKDSLHHEMSDQEHISVSPKRKHNKTHNSLITSPLRNNSNSSNLKHIDSLHYESSDADNVSKKVSRKSGKAKHNKSSNPTRRVSVSSSKTRKDSSSTVGTNRKFSTSSPNCRSRSASSSPKRIRSDSSSGGSPSPKRKMSTSSTKRKDSSSSVTTNRKNSSSTVDSRRSRSRSPSSPMRNRSVSSSSNRSVIHDKNKRTDKEIQSNNSSSPKKITSKSPKTRVSLSEKILFEDDLEEDPNSADEFKGTSNHTGIKSSLLRKFIARNPKLKPVKAISSEFAIDSDDEAYVFKCPMEFDTTKLKDMDITIDTKMKIRIDGQTYDGTLDESSYPLAILTQSVKNNGHFVIRSIKPNSTVIFRKKIPKTHIDETRIQQEHTSWEEISVLPETKQRHPIFGHDYKKFIELPSAIAGRLTEVPSPEKKAKSKSKQHIKIERKVKEDIDEVAEKKKKKRKRKLSDAGTSETEVKKVKREHDKKSWETEKAIEESLFNF